MKTLAQTYLVYIGGGSNKHYLARLVELADGTYEVPCLYGAIGKRAAETNKYAGPDRAKAEAAYTKVIAEKRGKGYREETPDLWAFDGFDLGDAAIFAATQAGNASTAATPTTASASSTPATPSSPAPIGVPKEDATGIPRFGAQLAGDRGLAALDEAIADPRRYRVEEKWDGFRALISMTADRTIAIRNRHGEDKGRIANTPHLEAALRALGDRHPELWSGTLFDGELVGRSWSDTAHLLGGAGRTDNSLRFVAFDLPWHAGADLRDLPLHARIDRLETLFRDATHPLETSAALVPSRELVHEIWHRGGEGLIIKQLDQPYLGGNRTVWSKVKQLQTAEAVVIGLEPGKGKYLGQVGALILAQYRDGELFEVTRVSGMSDPERALLGPDDVGRVCEFAFQERTDTSYRHPRFERWRPDKEAEDCTW